MVEEIVARIEQMEKNQQELREILTKDCDEHHEQMAHMMQVIMKMAQDKGTFDDIGFVNTIAQT